MVRSVYGIRMRTRRWYRNSGAVGALLVLACGDDGPEVLGPVPSGLVLVAEVPIPPNFGVHDTFVRDGLAFVAAWNTGIIILDVGNGIAGGTPSDPVEVSRLRTDSSGVDGARVHSAWWFQNPNTGERRYLFVGQEGPGQIGTSSSGDIHVVDVSDLANPREVASYRMNGTARSAGTHNFWMDEAGEILFAAYYNGGVVALDVSGDLSGNLASREIARFQPGTDSTYVWGVHYQNGTVYATDMLSGFYQLTFTGNGFVPAGGGTGEGTERFFSDLWVTDRYAYTGTWGRRGVNDGNVVNIWRLDDRGRPSIVRAFVIDDIGTVADLEVTSDGTALLVSATRGPDAGLHLYDLRDPERPNRVALIRFSQGIHAATLGVIDGTTYAFAARYPPSPALMIYQIER